MDRIGHRDFPVADFAIENDVYRDDAQPQAARRHALSRLALFVKSLAFTTLKSSAKASVPATEDMDSIVHLAWYARRATGLSVR